MKFSLDKNLTFEQAKALFFEQLAIGRLWRLPAA